MKIEKSNMDIKHLKSMIKDRDDNMPHKEWFAKHGSPNSKSKALHKAKTPAENAQANIDRHLKSKEHEKHNQHLKELEGRKESYYKFRKDL